MDERRRRSSPSRSTRQNPCAGLEPLEHGLANRARKVLRQRCADGCNHRRCSADKILKQRIDLRRDPTSFCRGLKVAPVEFIPAVVLFTGILYSHCHFDLLTS